MLDFLTAYVVKPIMKKQFSFNSELDRYISSKNPNNAAEVDYWMKEYEHKKTSQGWLI